MTLQIKGRVRMSKGSSGNFYVKNSLVCYKVVNIFYSVLTFPLFSGGNIYDSICIYKFGKIFKTR